MRALARLGATAPEGRHLSLRMGKMKAGPVVTDNGNFVIDAVFPFEHMRQPQKVFLEHPTLNGTAGSDTTASARDQADLRSIGSGLVLRYGKGSCIWF